MPIKNLASGTLAESVSASTTTLLVYVGEGSASTIRNVWPNTPFYATIMPANPSAGVANSLNSEIVKVTAVGNDQVGNTTLKVTRAQRGTTAKAFTAGAIVTNANYAEDAVLLGDYSTSEVNTGYHWIDGKTIYKKTVDCGSLPNNTTKNTSHGISNLSQIILIEGIAFRPADNIFFQLNNSPHPTVGLSSSINITVNSSNIAIVTGSDRSNMTAFVTLYYTKTS